MITKYCKSLIPVLFVLLVTSGCVDTQQLDEIRRMAESAQHRADTAYGTAQNALSVANDASLAAEQAKNSVGTALECCQDNRARIEEAMRENMRMPKGR